MVTLEDLNDYRYICAEIELLRRRIEELKNDTAPPWATGAQKKKYHEALRSLKLSYITRLNMCEKNRERIHGLIASIDDPLIAKAFDMRYIHGIRWNDIAKELENDGYYATVSGIKKMCCRYIQKRGE